MSGADDTSCCGVPMYELAVQASTDHCSRKMRVRPCPAARMPFSPIVTMQSYAAAQCKGNIAKSCMRRLKKDDAMLMQNAKCCWHACILTFMWSMPSENCTAADIVVSAIQLLTMELFITGVYDCHTTIIICSCQQVAFRRSSQLIDFCCCTAVLPHTAVCITLQTVKVSSFANS